MPILIPNRALIAASGKDTLELLQKLVTADLAPLGAAEGAIYTLLLTPQGRCRFDLFVVKRDGLLFLDVPAGQVAGLIAALELYRLRAEASFTIRPEATVLLDTTAANDVLSFMDPRHKALGWRNWTHAASVTGDAFDYDARRIVLGIVEPSQDLPDGSMPLEYGLDKLGAISFGKGCYLGQELTARMHNRDLAKHEVVVLPEAEATTGMVLAKAGGLALVQMRRSGK